VFKFEKTHTVCIEVRVLGTSFLVTLGTVADPKNRNFICRISL